MTMTERAIDSRTSPIGVVVLHYRFWPPVADTLQALLDQSRRPDFVVVVDNASGDGSTQEIARAFPTVDVVQMEMNVGYGAGMNAGVELLLARNVDAILLLTHECRLAATALEALVDRLQLAQNVAVVGPLLGYRSSPERVFSAGGNIERRSWRPRHIHEPALMDEWRGRPPHEVEWLDGAALLVRASAIKTAGGLDEDYFLYFEETEYLLRLRRLGWSVECVPAAMAWQEPGDRPSYLWLRNRLRFLARTAPKRHVVREVSRLALSVAKCTVSPDPRLSSEDIRDRRRALAHFLMRRWGPDGRDLADRQSKAVLP
jgi:GT2 family glycosyltransferase